MSAFSAILAACFLMLLSAGYAIAGEPPIFTVPEPTSLALIAAGAAVVAWVKFRGRR